MSRKPKASMARRKARLVAGFLRGSKRFFAISIACTAITALADMINPQIIRIAIDNVIGDKAPELPHATLALIEGVGGFAFLRSHLWIMALAVLVCSLFKVLSQYAFRVFNTKASETLVKTMRDRLFSHIEHLPFSWHMKNQTGDIIQRCTSDVDTVKNFVSEQLTSIFRIVLMLILSVVFMLSMNVKLTLIALIPMPIIILYSMRFHKKIGAGFARCDESEGVLSAMVQENLTGVRVVRAFGRERYENDRFRAHNHDYTELWIKLSRIMSRFWSTSDVLSGTQILLLVVMGAVFCLDGDLTAGEYIAFISYNSMLVWPIRQLGRMISELSKAGVAMERILYITESEIERDRPHALTPDMRGDIAFEHVSFAYENCPTVLHDLHFTMKAGTTLGILGGTGSGKSTMMLLLDKLYDIPEGCGRITVGGVDIADIKTEHLRRSIGIVLQEPYLFSRTIASNIGITTPNATLSEIREAARAACLDETVSGFSAGYDTFVGERGVTLSGGQKQRTAIARNLMRDTPILIFDDSLSAVDTETDARIRAELEKRFGKASVILISHRITTLSKADKILVLDGGRIVQEGSHDELKEADGLYRRIYLTQTQHDEQEESAV